MQIQERCPSVVTELLRRDIAPRDAMATVIAIGEDGRIEVDQGGRRLHCRRAHSCLTPAEAGDRVSIVSDGASDHYVCAVLHRPGAGAVRVQVQGDLELHAVDGDLLLHTDKRLRLRGLDEIDARCERMSFDTRQGHFGIDEATLRCKRAEVRVGLLRLVGQVLESAAERIVQACRHSVRNIETVDYLRAGQIDYSAAHDARLHAEHTFVTARKLAKLDGEQVHLG